jgi:hypothetical protein
MGDDPFIPPFAEETLELQGSVGHRAAFEGVTMMVEDRDRGKVERHGS